MSSVRQPATATLTDTRALSPAKRWNTRYRKETQTMAKGKRRKRSKKSGKYVKR